MDIQAIVTAASNTNQDINTLLQNHVSQLTPHAQLTQLTHLFYSAATTHEHLTSLAHHAWNYVLDNRLWEAAYATLHQFKPDID